MSQFGEEPTFSVIVPSYHRPQQLFQCLAGVQAGARVPDEVVVVLRDEDTDSQELLEQWRAANERGPRVKTVLATRPGQIAAMNCGLAAATGDVVCFTDDDCVPRPQWLAGLARHYADPLVGGVGGRDVVHHGDEQVPAHSRVVGKITWGGKIIGDHHCAALEGPVDVAHLKGANMSFRRALLAEFDEHLAGGSSCLNDTDASLHVTSQGFRLVYDPHAIVDHYPAQRFGDSTRQLDDPRLVYSDSHNWVYCMLKHLPPLRKVAFVSYALLVGMGKRYGLVKYLLRLPLGPLAATRLFRASTAGKLQGIRTYLKMKRAPVQSGVTGGKGERINAAP